MDESPAPTDLDDGGDAKEADDVEALLDRMRRPCGGAVRATVQELLDVQRAERCQARRAFLGFGSCRPSEADEDAKAFEMHDAKLNANEASLIGTVRVNLEESPDGEGESQAP